MNKRFAFLLTLLILVPVILAACGGDDEEEGGVTSESITSAWEAVLEGDPEPAKAISCEADHPNIEAAADAMGAAASVDGADASVSCEVDGDTATCELTILGETNTITSNIVDGQICGGTQPGG